MTTFSSMFHLGSSKFRRIASVAIAVLVLMFLAACQTPGSIKSSGPGTPAVPDEARLRARLTEFHNALGANDISKRYAMATPGIREKMSFEEFKKDMR